MTIRPATQADQPTIRRLIREANLNPMSLQWPNFLVAEEDGAIIGLGQVKQHRDGSRELASLAVLPGRQGEGFGSAIVTSLLARERGRVLYLTCRSQLEGYYQRFEFHRLERADYPPYFRRFIPVFNSIGRLFRTKILVMRRS